MNLINFFAYLFLFIIFQTSMPGHHNYTKSQNIEALSIFNQKNLQKRGEKPDRRHLLGLLCSYTRQQISVRNEEVEQQLCCFDRMKKLICSQDIEAADAEQNQINSIMIEQKINQMQAKMNKTLKKENSIKTHKRISSSHNFSRRSCIIEDLKKGCMQKYVNHQVLKRDKQIGQVRKVIEKQVHSKVNQIVEDRGLQFLKLKEDYEALKKQMLAKNLEIEGLKSKQNQMKQYITDLQQRTKCHKETKRDTQPKQQGQSFQQRFRQTFGEYTIEQLKARLEVSIGKCLDGFERVQNKNQIKLQDQRKVYQQKQARMKARINQLQFSENQLMSNLKNLKINKNISEIEFDNLLKAKLQLQNLQKWILSLFTEWHQQRSQSEKKVLNIIGCLDQNYSYEQMLKYIVEYGKKYSSHDKLNDYLFKVLRGIQKLRRIIWPQLCNEKLDPLATIESLQKWIKLRVSVPQYNKKIGTARQSNYLANEQLS